MEVSSRGGPRHPVFMKHICTPGQATEISCGHHHIFDIIDQSLYNFDMVRAGKAMHLSKYQVIETAFDSEF